MEKKQIKLLVGACLLDIKYDWMTSWNSFWTDVIRSAEFEVGCSFKFRQNTFIAQENLAREAVDSGCTHLLLVDDDIFDYTLLDLTRLLDADVDMIGGVMLTKKFPFFECAMRRIDPTRPLVEHCKRTTGFDMYAVPVSDQKGVKPVDLISFGFTLISTDLLKRIKRPYFIPDPNKINFDECHYEYLNFTDSIFCDKVLELGVQPYAHFDVRLNHNGVTRNNLAGWMEIYKQSGKLTQPGIEMNDKQFLEYKMTVKTKMTEAEERFHSESINKLKFYKEKKDEPSQGKDAKKVVSGK